MASPLYIVGPTASGKTALAILLAKRLGGEVVNADAFQLYRGLDIITGKPTLEERQSVPHHLFDVLSPEMTCDAQRFREMALPVIDAISARGRLPIVVGGSGLYLKALTHGLDPLPAGDPELRRQLSTQSLEEKVAHLLRLDPAAASNVPLRNPRYVDRALEICLITGRRQSELRMKAGAPAPQVAGFCLSWSREELYARINERVRRMIDHGAVAEVARLGPVTGALLKAIGVREILGHIDGVTDLETTVAAIQQATRRYAKRQLTWFRREAYFQTICLTRDADPESTCEWIESRLALRPLHPHA